MLCFSYFENYFPLSLSHTFYIFKKLINTRTYKEKAVLRTNDANGYHLTWKSVEMQENIQLSTSLAFVTQFLLISLSTSDIIIIWPLPNYYQFCLSLHLLVFLSLRYCNHLCIVEAQQMYIKKIKLYLSIYLVTKLPIPIKITLLQGWSVIVYGNCSNSE